MVPGHLRVIAGSEIPVADRTAMHSREDDEAWMLLTFSSDYNYLDVAQRKQMHLSVNEALCTEGHVVREIMSSSILAGPPPASLMNEGLGAASPSKRYIYRTYLAMSAPRRVAAGGDPGPAAGYDLRSETRDLCIQIRGGNMVGMTVASGIAVFSSALVKAAVVPDHPSP
jgi:hypothetical protein